MLALDPVAAAADTLDPATTLDGFLAAIERRAFRFAEASLGHREDALDALQDTMIKLMAYRERPVAEWTPLFWSILRSRIVDTQRRRLFRLRWISAGTEREGGSVIDWADDGPDPTRSQEGREAYGLFVQGLQRLPQRQRETFTLRILEELDGETTARIMGCSQGAVKTHLSRAREALQRQLQDFR